VPTKKKRGSPKTVQEEGNFNPLAGRHKKKDVILEDGFVKEKKGNSLRFTEGKKSAIKIARSCSAELNLLRHSSCPKTKKIHGLTGKESIVRAVKKGAAARSSIEGESAAGRERGRRKKREDYNREKERSRCSEKTPLARRLLCDPTGPPRKGRKKRRSKS